VNDPSCGKRKARQSFGFHLTWSDGIYHPALFNERLLFGLKGIMSEANCTCCARA
jgi:hypothetical protein